MKSIICIIMAAVISLSLTACKRNVEPAPVVSEPPASETPARPSAKPEEPAETRLADGVYRLDTELTLSGCQGMLIKGGYLIISYETEPRNGALYAIDLYTGERTAYDVAGTGGLYDLGGDAFGFIGSGGLVYRFDSPKAAPRLVFSDNSDYTVRFLRDGSLYRATDAKTVFYDENGEQKFTLDFTGEYDYSSVRYIYGGAIYMTAGEYNGQAVALKIDSGTGEYVKIGDYAQGYDWVESENALWSKTGGSADIFMSLKSDPGDMGSPVITTVNANETLLDASDEYAATQYFNEDGSSVALYDRNNDLLYFGSPAASDGMVLLAHYQDESGLYLCYQDYSTGSAEIFRLDPRELDAIERPEPDGELPPRFADGITVLTGEEAILSFNQFEAQPITDQTLIEQGREIAMATLAEFPSGFFDELLTGKTVCSSLVICLTGELTTQNDQLIEAPGGFAYTAGTVRYIAADATRTDQLRSTLCHEMMHVIDRYLLETVGDAYPDWSLYVPEDPYYNAYRAEDGGDINDFTYTENGHVSDDDVWFPTPYCRTYAVEDRAVLFDLMFTHNEYYTQFYHITDRMAYLAQVLRANFTSVDSAVEVIWE